MQSGYARPPAPALPCAVVPAAAGSAAPGREPWSDVGHPKRRGAGGHAADERAGAGNGPQEEALKAAILELARPVCPVEILPAGLCREGAR